jgi:hypothetical protein
MPLVAPFALPLCFYPYPRCLPGVPISAANHLLFYIRFHMPEVEVFMLRGSRLRTNARSHPSSFKHGPHHRLPSQLLLSTLGMINIFQSHGHTHSCNPLQVSFSVRR